MDSSDSKRNCTYLVADLICDLDEGVDGGGNAGKRSLRSWIDIRFSLYEAVSVFVAIQTLSAKACNSFQSFLLDDEVFESISRVCFWFDQTPSYRCGVVPHVLVTHVRPSPLIP